MKVQGQTPASNYDGMSTRGFIENKGQIYDQQLKPNHEVRYLLHTQSMNVQLKQHGFSYDTYISSPIASKQSDEMTFPNKRSSPHNAQSYLKFHRVDIIFHGCNPSPKITAKNKSSGFLTYYVLGNSKGITVGHYQQVIYEELYDGIDLIFESSSENHKNGFEYYFVVKPGADPSKIRLQYKGAQTNLKDNKIVIKTKLGDLEEKIPASWTSKEKGDISLAPRKNLLKVKYKFLEKSIYSFSIPAYDKKQVLIIDPTPDLQWGTYYGGYTLDISNCIDRDINGNITVGGIATNSGLATSGVYQSEMVGDADAIVVKLAADGSLLWATYFGGESVEEVYDICSDNNGNVYAVGFTMSQTGIATPEAFQTSHGGIIYTRDAFITKFDATGNREWSTYFGGTEADFAYGIKAGRNGNIYVGGFTYSSNGISSPGAFQEKYAGATVSNEVGDGFLAQFTSTGERVWSTYFGGSLGDYIYDLALDGSDNIYLVGNTHTQSGLATAGSFQSEYGGGSADAILVKFSSLGSRLWLTYYGGSGFEFGQSVSVDNQNNVVICGTTSSLDRIATSGVHQPQYGGEQLDGFVAKFDSNGKRLWGSYYGGNQIDWAYCVTTDADNNIIMGGYSTSHNNIATPNAYITYHVHGYMVKFSSAGLRRWGTYIGGDYIMGTFATEVRGLVTDDSGNIFATGPTGATNNIATCNAVQKNYSGNSSDMFIAKFVESSKPIEVSVAIKNGFQSAVCQGMPVTFTATVLNGGTTPQFEWKVNGQSVGIGSQTFTTDTFKDGDLVSCIVTSSSSCVSNPVSSSNVDTVKIMPAVIPKITIRSNIVGRLCKGAPVTFTGIPENEGDHPEFKWKINGIETGQNKIEFKTNSINHGDVVSCELTNKNSCSMVTVAVSNPIVVDVKESEIPFLTITSQQLQVCEGATVTFTAASTNAGVTPSYQWTVNRVPAGDGTVYSYRALNGDSVRCFLEPNNSTCNTPEPIASNEMVAIVYPAPTVVIEPTKPIINKGDTIELVAYGDNISAYSWTPNQNISNVNIKNPVVWPMNSQSYFVEALSGQGCKTLKEIAVTVISTIYVPNAFTPNADGLNDYWVIRGLENLPNCRVRIYNRYGEMIFSSKGYLTPWDGFYKSKGQPIEIFAYVIDLGNGKKSLSGTVTVIR